MVAILLVAAAQIRALRPGLRFAVAVARDHAHGRIWRVHYKDRPLVKPAKIAGASPMELLRWITSAERYPCI